MKDLIAWLRAKWQNAFTGSTVLEGEWWPGQPARGGLLRIPGQMPKREQSFFWRLWQTIRGTWA